MKPLFTNIKSIALLVAASSIAIVLSGCAGYHVGSTLPEGINVVNVPIFVNKTSEPLLETITTSATISELQRDGTLSVGDLNKSDIVLYVSLTDLTLTPLRYDNDRNTTTREYRLTIKASLRLENRKTGKTMTRNMVAGEWDFIPTGDLSSAKRQVLPKAARDLAHNIVEKVVEFW
jgi:hypothetical protein